MRRIHFYLVGFAASLAGGGAGLYLKHIGARADLPSAFVGAMMALIVFSTLCAWAAP